MPDTARSVERRLLDYRKPARRWLYISTAAGFGAAAMAVVIALLLSAVVSAVFIEGRGLSGVRLLLLAAVAAGLLRGLLLAGAEVAAQHGATDLKRQIREDLLGHLSTLGPAYSRRERTGELLNAAVAGVDDLDAYMTQYQPARLLAGLVPILVAVVVFAIDPLSVLVLLVTGPLLVVFLTLIGSRTRDAAQRRFVELGWMSSYFLDLLQGLPTLKMFGRSKEQVENIRTVSQSYGHTTMQVLRTAFETSFVLELSATVATALVAVEVGIRLTSGGLPFGPALAVLVIVPEFFLPLRQLSTHYHAKATGIAATERIFAILDTPVPSPQRSRRPVQHAADGLQLSHVAFAYENGRRPALRDVSMSIPRGSKVALVGETGAGKSTVASLILRFIEPNSGSISVDGLPLADFPLAAWRKQVAWVPQQPHLFHGTLADNIRMARPDATDRELHQAASAAGVDAFAERLPHGYDTPIGENGLRLSGGEQQRLAIARAFIKDAPFLILDEPTSHLDAVNEALIRESLERLMGERTALIIAHRVELTYCADQVVVLRGGRVVEPGSHQRLDEIGDLRSRLVITHEGGAA